MFDNLLRKMSIKGNSIYGIELNLGGSKSRYWTLVQLRMGKNKEVKIVKQEYFEEAFDAKQLVGLKLEKSIPIVLCVTGTGVLTNRLGEGDSINNLFSGLDESEIYYKEYEVSAICYAGVIRKDILANHIEQIANQSFFVWDVAVSSLSVLSILPLLQVPKQEFQLERYTIRLSPIIVEQISEVEEASFLSERCFIGTEQTTVTMLPSLAAAVSFYVNKEIPDENLLRIQQKELKAFRKSKLAGYSFLGLLLIVLLVNFLLYSKYIHRLEDLQLALNDKQKQNMHLNTLKKDLSEKQAILATMGIQREVPLSYIADRFAACTPKGIKLDKLDINPLADKIKDHKPILFSEGKLRVEGICDNPEDLNLLLERLKKEEWLIKVDKKEYRESDLKGRFILEISYE
ncbi:MAG: hypothetical protein LBG19_00415 [Prevotellaceae bacterium]|jgi:hypothetical protein|nr:hypothetical protein [Prevotellaceae bacterium]